MLQIKKVSCLFGGLAAIDDVSLSIEEGELVGLMGPNGAGKTTLFNIIHNFVSPTQGDVYLKGEKITGLFPHEVTRKGIVRTFQNVRIFEHLNVIQNIEVAVPIAGRLSFWQELLPVNRGKWAKRFIRKRAVNCLEMVGLCSVAEKNVSSLTFGQQRLLGIARAIAADPKILLFDEPSAGLNQDETFALCGVIQQINREGVAVFIIEHDIGMLMNIAHRIIVLSKGKKIMEGTPGQVKREDKVMQAYFGRKKECFA